MPENTIELRVGRLVEVRVAKGYESVEDVAQMGLLVRAQQSRLPANLRAVSVADWRSCGLMSPAAAEQVLQLMIAANGIAERSALLYSERSPVAVMQFLRLVRDAQNPNRRLFSDPLALTAWLGEVLTREEMLRLREFLGPSASARTK